MPRATFQGVTFDFVLAGLEDRHEGMVGVREVPGADASDPTAYVDFGGARLHRRAATLKVDAEADYLALAALVGTSAARGTLDHPAEGAPRTAVLLTLARTWRRGAGPQLCRSEWLLLPPTEA